MVSDPLKQASLVKVERLRAEVARSDPFDPARYALFCVELFTAIARATGDRRFAQGTRGFNEQLSAFRLLEAKRFPSVKDELLALCDAYLSNDDVKFADELCRFTDKQIQRAPVLSKDFPSEFSFAAKPIPGPTQLREQTVNAGATRGPSPPGSDANDP